MRPTVYADDLIGIDETFAHRSMLEREVISLGARLVQEINAAKRDALSAPQTLDRVRRLNDCRAALVLLQSLQEHFAFLETPNLLEVVAGLDELEAQFQRRGFFALAAIGPIDPDDHLSVAEVLAPLLSASIASDAGSPPQRSTH